MAETMIVIVESAALLATTTLPLTPPLEVMLAPLTVTAETVKLDVPAFLRVTGSISDLPAVTVPKFRLVLEAVSSRVALEPVPLSA